MARENAQAEGWEWPGEAYYLTLKQIRPNMAAYVDVLVPDIQELNDLMDPETHKVLDDAKWSRFNTAMRYIRENWELHRLDDERREIQNTEHECTQDWPDDIRLIQGGDRGLVVGKGGNYRTAFVEVFPEGTFIRGEGPTVHDAEMDAWRKYQLWLNCVRPEGHGDYDRRNYKNGGCFCGHCGTWMGCILDEIPEDPAEPKSLLRRLLGDDDAEGTKAFNELAEANRNAEDRTTSNNPT